MSFLSDLSLSATYLSYHTFKRLSRVFQNFFEAFFQKPVSIKSVFLPKAASLAGFASLSRRSLVRQLCYITTFHSVCQHLFSIFFLFLQIVYFHPLFFQLPSSFVYALYFFDAISFYIIYYGNNLMPDSLRNQAIRLIYQRAGSAGSR